MANPTFNAGVDYFGLVANTNPVVGVTSSNENNSAQSARGANTEGDIAAVDMYGETAAPSAEYKVIGEVTAENLVAIGTVKAAAGDIPFPVILESLNINTSSGSAPTISASGRQVQEGAETLRTYALPASLAISPRHRAQDVLACMEIKKGTTAADAVKDYGLTSATFAFTATVSVADPKGVVKNFDIQGGTIVGNYTMNWYASTAPTIALKAAAVTAGYVMTAPVSKSHPENGYTEYTWSVTLPVHGEEAE